MEGPLQTAHLYGDAEALKRLITNLLQNALKYTDANGEVKVSLETVSRQTKLVIADTGIGIASENLQHLFNRFYRVDPSRSRNAGGSGLGLSIVKAIVDAHKGKIEVQSGLGKGTTLSILLPLK
jgi:signal transduction histidine kinase